MHRWYQQGIQKNRSHDDKLHVQLHFLNLMLKPTVHETGRKKAISADGWDQ